MLRARGLMALLAGIPASAFAGPTFLAPNDPPTCTPVTGDPSRCPAGEVPVIGSAAAGDSGCVPADAVLCCYDQMGRTSCPLREGQSGVVLPVAGLPIPCLCVYGLTAPAGTACVRLLSSPGSAAELIRGCADFDCDRDGVPNSSDPDLCRPPAPEPDPPIPFQGGGGCRVARPAGSTSTSIVPLGALGLVPVLVAARRFSRTPRSSRRRPRAGTER